MDKLLAVAKTESTDSSNKIGEIVIGDARLKPLINQKTTPENRSGEGISGYRDVLATIHENHEYLKITPNNLLVLYKQHLIDEAQVVGDMLQGTFLVMKCFNDKIVTPIKALISMDFKQHH